MGGLARAYLGELGRPGDDDALEAALAEALAAGRSAWPEVPVAPGAFAAHVARCGETAVADLCAADLYLACACAGGEPRALAAFDRRYLARVPVYLAQLRRPAEFADEVAQTLRERLFVAAAGERPRICAYAGRGALESWVRVAAVRTALDLAAAGRRHVAAGDLGADEALGAAVDPDLVYLRQRYLPEFRAAFVRALERMAPQDRNLLRFYLVDGLSIGQIGPLFGKSRATVGRMVVECRERLLAETRRQLGDTLGTDGSDVDSIMRALQSQLDVTIRRFLRPDDAP